jgi:hypothetical protein
MEAQYLNSVAGSAYIREKWSRPCSPNLFAKLACKGTGPRYVKIGRFRAYTTEWLDDWVKAQIVGPLQSTSESPGGPNPQGRCGRPRKLKTDASCQLEAP